MKIHAKHLTKSYENKAVLSDLSFDLEEGGRYCLTGRSGSGKTTLLRILLGLEKADSGDLSMEPVYKGILHAGVVFQEDRLAEHFSPVENIRCACPKRGEKEIREHLTRLLEVSCLDQPVSRLSGGMKRRVALVRAMLSPSGLLLLDEPFAGLDINNREKCLAYILENQGDRILVLTSHEAMTEEGFAEISVDTGC